MAREIDNPDRKEIDRPQYCKVEDCNRQTVHESEYCSLHRRTES